MITSQAELFTKLGAPLKNVRWSWGGVHEHEKIVFLRVWQDGTQVIENKRYVWILDEVPRLKDLGATERFNHIKLIESGYQCYLVMCQAVDTKAGTRQVQSFNRKEVFLGGEVIISDNNYYIELKDRVSVKNIQIKLNTLIINGT